MQFSNLKTVFVAGVALMGAPAFGALTSSQIKGNLDLLTLKSRSLIAPAKGINLVSSALALVGAGPVPQVVAGLTDIVSTIGVGLTQLQGSLPVPAGAAADGIFESFRSFVRVHQDLLNNLIGNAGLFSTLPLIGDGVSQVLRNVESASDTLTTVLYGLVPSQSNNIRIEAETLKALLVKTQNKYTGLLAKTKMVKRGHGVVIEAAA